MKLTNVLVILVFTAVASTFATYQVVKSTPEGVKTFAAVHANALMNPAKKCPYKVERINGYEYTKPLLFGAPACEPDKYEAMKNELNRLVNGYKKDGMLSAASVYLIDFDRSEWMSINDDSLFHEGSLMKLPLLITYLKMSEKKPELLSQKLKFTKGAKGDGLQSSADKHIEAGQVYTIRELLEYMIKYSDNNATYLLNANIDLEALKKTFEELNLTKPDVKDKNIMVRADDYSRFLIVLYNAGYLTMADSEYALKLLSETEFKTGFAAGLPAEVTMTHKFGEWSDAKGNREIHESGIIYINDKAYVLTVLTKGKEANKLVEVISSIAKLVYNKLNVISDSNALANGQNKNI